MNYRNHFGVDLGRGRLVQALWNNRPHYHRLVSEAHWNNRVSTAVG